MRASRVGDIVADLHWDEGGGLDPDLMVLAAWSPEDDTEVDAPWFIAYKGVTGAWLATEELDELGTRIERLSEAVEQLGGAA